MPYIKRLITEGASFLDIEQKFINVNQYVNINLATSFEITRFCTDGIPTNIYLWGDIVIQVRRLNPPVNLDYKVEVSLFSNNKKRIHGLEKILEKVEDLVVI